MAKKKTDLLAMQVNKYIGQRIKMRRDMLGITQKFLADACGVTFQQIQKYEVGETRIAAERLYQIALILDIPVEFLFTGLAESSGLEFVKVPPAAHSPKQEDPLTKSESLELVKLYWALPSDALRQNIKEILNSLK